MIGVARSPASVLFNVEVGSGRDGAEVGGLTGKGIRGGSAAALSLDFTSGDGSRIRSCNLVPPGNRVRIREVRASSSGAAGSPGSGLSPCESGIICCGLLNILPRYHIYYIRFRAHPPQDSTGIGSRHT